MNTLIRRGAAGAAILLSFGFLAGCSDPKPSTSSSTAASASATPSVEEKAVTDALLDKVNVTGEALKQPEVKVQTPFKVEKTAVKVLSEGKGAEVQADGQITVHYHGVNGRDGKVFDSSFKSGKPVTFPLNGVIRGFKLGLQGQKVGSRVLIGVPGPDGYDANGGSPQAGIQKGDTLLFVCDIVATSLTGPEGTPVAAVEGLPTVSGEKVPEVKIPDGYKVPDTTKTQLIIEGNGAAVADTDAITVNYIEIDAATGKQLTSTYSKAAETGLVSRLVPGWKKGLVGQKIGSRVLLVVPKNEDLKKEDKVYVVDILFAQAAGQ